MVSVPPLTIVPTYGKRIIWQSRLLFPKKEKPEPRGGKRFGLL
jgi:hypothetical protein